MKTTIKTTIKKDKRGGNRINSGRKPVSDKKKQVCIYIEQSIIDKVGGIYAIKESIYNYCKHI